MQAGTIVRGDVDLREASGCYVRAEHAHMVAALGVRDLVIVETDDAVLVADRSRSQEVKGNCRDARTEGADRACLTQPGLIDPWVTTRASMRRAASRQAHHGKRAKPSRWQMHPTGRALGGGVDRPGCVRHARVRAFRAKRLDNFLDLLRARPVGHEDRVIGLDDHEIAHAQRRDHMRCSARNVATARLAQGRRRRARRFLLAS